MKTMTKGTASKELLADQQALQAATNEAAAKVAEIDAQIGKHEVTRDAAEGKLATLAAGPGDPVAQWRAEEDHEAAEAAIKQLLTERRPWADRHRRLAAVAEPLRQRDREAAELRHAIAGMELLAEALPLLDRMCELIEQARPHFAESRGRAAVPPSLTKFVGTWGPNGWTRARVEYSVGLGGLDKMRDRLAWLEAGQTS